ncbi:MAG TPA: FG-GAP-like repeat-containing protein [Candidatus Binatia bacterium]|nr:FG-GAP-like repeat-containing protein [Candidatus Binatia bacterium]
MRHVLALVLVLLGAGGLALAGGPLVSSTDGAPVGWSTATAVRYTTDRSGLGLLSRAEAVRLAGDLFAVWEGVPTATITFARDGGLAVDVDGTNFGPYLGPYGGATTPLGQSVIVFDADGAIFDTLFGVGTGILGFAGPTFLSDGAVTVPIGAPVPPGSRIVEGLAFLNGKWIDGVDDPAAGNHEMSLELFKAVFVHEFGHFAGLDHTQVHGLMHPPDSDLAGYTTPVETMYPFISDASQAVPERDDVVALSALYPVPTFAATTGAVRGRVLAQDGTPLSGINVIARNLADDSDALSYLSGATLVPPGAYTLAGLVPGASYRIEIQEVDVFAQGGSRIGPFSPPVTLPGPPEFYNGAQESADPATDDPRDATPIVAAAGAIAQGIDIVVNDQAFRVRNTALGEPRGPLEFAVGDFDGDGDADFVAPQIGFVPGNLVRFYRGHGDGTFFPPVDVAAFPGNEHIVAGQLNRGVDGFLDVAVASTTMQEVRLYRGNGQGGFAPPLTLLDAPDQDRLTDLVVADLDGDPYTDLFTVIRRAAGGATAYSLLGRPDGGFTTVASEMPAGTPFPETVLRAGKFAGGPAVDVAGLASAAFAPSIVVLVGDGAGRFQASSASIASVAVRVDPYAMAAADFNGDGRTDLALADLQPAGGAPNFTRSYIDVLLSTGAGAFVLGGRTAVPDVFQLSVVAADFDRDGLLDVASTGALFSPRSPGAKVTVAYGDGTGAIARVDTIWGLAEFPQELAVADLDGNGRSDLLVSLNASGPIGFDPPGTYAVLLRPSTCFAQSECDDGIFCNGVESCGGGSCHAGTPPSCDDGDVCTEDLCGLPMVLSSEAFESGFSGWTHASRGGTDTWHQDYASCLAERFPSVMFSSNGNAGLACQADSSMERSQLLGPPVALPSTGRTVLSFDALSRDEAGACLASGDRDAHDAGITLDGGATYTTLNDCTRLADGTGAVTHHEFDLGAFAGRTVQVMFVYDTRDALAGHTFAVDNVTITAAPDSCGHVPIFPDDDLDVHVDARCGGNDCDDHNPSVWSAPFEVGGLVASGASPTGLAWQGQDLACGPETRYDLVSGPLSPGSGPVFPSSTCLSSTTAVVYDDARPAPPAGSAWWYLVRSRNSCGAGSYGTPLRDAGIPACP